MATTIYMAVWQIFLHSLRLSTVYYHCTNALCLPPPSTHSMA